MAAELEGLEKYSIEMDFGGVKEQVVTRQKFPLEKARKVLIREVVAVGGYGRQGRGQALNMRDNKINVIVGANRNGDSWNRALEDKWVEDENLFDLKGAAKRGTIFLYLLQDADQKKMWPGVRRYITPRKAIGASHGFSFTYGDQTGVLPPKGVDVILMAPKGAGRTVRTNFEAGSGINSSIAVLQDVTGHALERVLAWGIAAGSGYLFPTTFKNEVYSDLTGERGVLMGATYGLCQAGYNNLRLLGLGQEEAFKHTVEVTTQLITKIIGDEGGDVLAATWGQKSPLFINAFELVRDTTRPMFELLYRDVAQGVETRRVIEENSRPDSGKTLNGELAQIASSELGMAGATVRANRPTYFNEISRYDLIMAGGLLGLMHAQYELFRSKGHSASEAFNETVEEATQSLIRPLIDENGIEWMYSHCSTTAQRGALDWNPRFMGVLVKGLRPLYAGATFEPRYGWGSIADHEMWQAGKAVRALRPENWVKRVT